VTAHALLLDAVSEVARVAGKTALDLFGVGIDVELKENGSPVTQADRAAERAARDWIEQRFPEHGIVGEELGVHRANAEYRWFIDPIDGTQSFIRGVPLWGTLVAVARGEDVLAGAIYCPAAEELVCAAIGEGCWRNCARTRVSQVSRLADATVLTTDERFPRHPERRAAWQRLASSARMARSWGDCYGYLLVAAGRADVMVDPALAPWDVAALYPCLTEAGGVITDWTGKATVFGDGAIATNGALAAEVRSALGVPAEGRA
jgi:histidinol-phosphatase